MSLRFSVFGIDLPVFQRCFGSNDRALAESLAQSPEMTDEDKSVCLRILRDGAPIPGLPAEGKAEKRAVLWLAQHSGLTKIDTEGWKVGGLGDLARNFPWLVSPACPLAWLLSGRPLLAPRFATFGWSYYAYLDRGEVRAVGESLTALRESLPKKQPSTLPQASADLAMRARSVRTKDELDALSAELLKVADGEKLVYAAMESVDPRTGNFAPSATLLIRKIRERDDRFADMREYANAMVKWFDGLQQKQLDAWIWAE